uniref:Ankyrin repeat domain-containing protein 26-like n=1 Tax=Callorhinus ursinus TaxID=34884 RepID=A0A3Q7NJN6_CALUR|nr:ankyrin repeat domain-containing protein 26-like [Callorhinus ursinus]
MKHMYQNEHGKQESLEERLSQLQSENMLLQQQLDDAHNKAASKENVVINIQDQFQDIIKKLQAESEKQGLWLEERNKELINECNLLKERMYQYEKEKAEREVAVRHLQLELADALKKQSMSEASLEVTSRCRINLEDETQDLRKKLGQIRRQVCFECENDKLKVTVKKQEGKIEQLLENLLSTSSVDDLTAKLESASSKCLYLDAKNQLLTQELSSMKEMQKKYEKLEKNKKKLKQQVVHLRSHLELSMVEYSKIEQYKWELEERIRLDITEKLKEASLFLQTQVASQERLGQLRETNNASIRSQMELRIKELEFELSRMKSSRDFYKTELEKHKQLYVEELKVQTSLTNELSKTNEKLAESSTRLLVEKQQKQSLINTITMRPVLDLPSVRNINNSSLLNRNVAPRENLVILTPRSRPTNNGIETFLTKVSYVIFFSWVSDF